MTDISGINSGADNKQIDPRLQRISDATHHDPFEVLGRHRVEGMWVIRIFHPLAETISLSTSNEISYRGKKEFFRIPETDFFTLSARDLPIQYQLQWTDNNNNTLITEDPYRFGPTITDFDLHLFNEGQHHCLYDLMGAHAHTIDGVNGIRFALWAPSAKRVSVVGDFNNWDGRVHPMRNRGDSGVWELFLPAANAGDNYKFEILDGDNTVKLKQDPYANAFAMRPDTSCRINNSAFEWTDDQWITERSKNTWQHQPVSIYEVHLGSWQQADDGTFLNYRTLAHKIVEYVLFMGFTHIELMPITEHPLDDSWGYQVTGYFAPSSRFGNPDDFRYFIDHCHQQGIGVILDWVPAHFPRDDFSLAKFDGTCLYEHEDPRRGEHRDWGTLIFNYGRPEVSNFLVASAIYWLREFHIDGLRVDAVASMLYLDYSRESGDWLPNEHGGRENLEAIDFLRKLNQISQTEVPGAIIIAEESTSWPQVTRPADNGGLGFCMKWNMGWMHDSLGYMAEDPINRRHHHNNLTFGLLYLFTENFVLPFSHDEVVHGKGSMLGKMPGDEWQQFANLRLLYCYQFTYPGKKLLFQGCEFAQRQEWKFNAPLDWSLTDQPAHRGIMTLIADLNRLYKQYPSLHAGEFEQAGFEWVNADDANNSVISFIRRHNGESLMVILNFTPVPRENYCLGVDKSGQYAEVFNSDSAAYNGSNLGNEGHSQTTDTPCMGRPHTLSLTLPPLAAIVLSHTSNKITS